MMKSGEATTGNLRFWVRIGGRAMGHRRIDVYENVNVIAETLTEEKCALSIPQISAIVART
jgi:hypothetical protein